MKKNIIFLLLVIASVNALFAQAKKPSMMVVPSDRWCIANGYYNEMDSHGDIEKIPNYKMALQEDKYLTQVISKLGEMMSERDFPLVDLNSTIKQIENEKIIESVETSEDYDVVAESPVEALLRVAKADILMQIDWELNTFGPQKSISFTLQGLDSYTNKQIAASSGTGEKTTSVEIPLMLSAAVVNNIEVFATQLTDYFNNTLAVKGREITLECRRWDSADVNFESEVGGDELGFLIEDWVAENTVNGSFNTSDASANRMNFTQVFIPLVTDRGRAVDARYWARGLIRELSNYGITAKLTIRGLGKAIVTIGSK